MFTRVKDGKVFVLPGDTMYPNEVSLLEKQIINKSDITIDEFRKMTPMKNRIEYYDSPKDNIFLNVYSKI